MNLDIKTVWETVKEIARQMIERSFEEIGGKDPVEREEYAVKWCTEQLEKVDHSLPAIGQYMDLPIVDWMQRQAVRQIVRALIRREYAARKLEIMISSEQFISDQKYDEGEGNKQENKDSEFKPELKTLEDGDSQNKEGGVSNDNGSK